MRSSYDRPVRTPNDRQHKRCQGRSPGSTPRKPTIPRCCDMNVSPGSGNQCRRDVLLDSRTKMKRSFPPLIVLVTVASLLVLPGCGLFRDPAPSQYPTQEVYAEDTTLGTRDVFEVRDFLIQRCFIYLDPDYAGLDTARYHWLSAGGRDASKPMG